MSTKTASLPVPLPAGAAGRRKILASDLGLLLATRAFWLLIGIPIDTTVSDRVIESRAGQQRGGPYGAIEDEITARRHYVASQTRERLVQRSRSALPPVCRPTLRSSGSTPAVHRPRWIALIRLLLLFERLAERPVTATQDDAFLDFCARCLDVLGLNTDGLEDAVRRLIQTAKKLNAA